MAFIAGATFLLWFGPTARLTISDPILIKEIFTSKSEFFEKYDANPQVRNLEGDSLQNLEGEKWVHHRRIIAPTFHMENLKVSSVFERTSLVLLILLINYFNSLVFSLKCWD